MVKERKLYKGFHIDADQMRALQALSKKTRVPMGVIMRQGLDMVLEWFEEREEALERGLAFIEREDQKRQ